MEVQINRQELQKLYGNETESSLEVFLAFLESKDEVINDLGRVFTSRNNQLIRQKLHYHAAVFGYIGFMQVSILFKEMEKKYTAEINSTEMLHDYNKIIDIVTQVSLALTREAAQLKTAC